MIYELQNSSLGEKSLIYQWLVIFMIVLMTICSACSNGVRVYYASSGGSSVSINVNGIDQVPRTNEWIDSEAEMHKQIDVLGKTVEGDYKKRIRMIHVPLAMNMRVPKKIKTLISQSIEKQEKSLYIIMTLMPNTSGLTICRALY